MTTPEVAELLQTLRDETAELELLLTLGNPSSSELKNMHQRIARSRLRALQAVVESFGWPDRHMGEGAPRAALDLLVAAATDTTFLRRCLQLAQEAADQGRIPIWHPPVIEDLLGLAERGKQHYGTQLRWTGERWEPHPITDPRRVAHRRRKVGLQATDVVLRRFDPAEPDQ